MEHDSTYSIFSSQVLPFYSNLTAMSDAKGFHVTPQPVFLCHFQLSIILLEHLTTHYSIPFVHPRCCH